MQILVYLVLVSVGLLALVGTPILMYRAAKRSTRLGLNGTDMPGYARGGGIGGEMLGGASPPHRKPADDATYPMDGDAHMPVYDPTYDWPADPGGTVSDLRSYGTASKKPKGDV